MQIILCMRAFYAIKGLSTCSKRLFVQSGMCGGRF